MFFFVFVLLIYMMMMMMMKNIIFIEIQGVSPPLENICYDRQFFFHISQTLLLCAVSPLFNIL